MVRRVRWLALAGCLHGGAALAAEPPAGLEAGARARPVPAPTLYRYADPAGRTVYSDRPPPAGVQATQLPYTPSPPRRPAPPVVPPAAAAAKPAMPRPGLPAESPPGAAAPSRGVQQVLLEQLAKQIESLQTSRNALKEGEAVRNGDERNYQRYLDRVQSLRDAVTRQEGVVEALQEQLRLLGTASLAE